MRLQLVHAALVHVPVAFLVVGGSIEALALLGRRARAARFGGGLVLVGAIALVPTIAAGFLAENIVRLSPEAHATLEAHERNGWLVLAAFAGLVIWKAWNRGEVPERVRIPYALALFAGVSLVVWGAVLGGELVYGYGVGVGVG